MDVGGVPQTRGEDGSEFPTVWKHKSHRVVVQDVVLTTKLELEDVDDDVPGVVVSLRQVRLLDVVGSEDESLVWTLSPFPGLERQWWWW